MTRQEVYKIIKDNHLEEEIKNNLARNYTNISTECLENFLNKRKPEKILSGMTTSQSNNKCNKLIIDILRTEVNRDSGNSFMNILYNLGLAEKKDITECSQRTLWKVNSEFNRHHKIRR